MTEGTEGLSAGKYLVPIEECLVHIIMGSASDLPVARKGVKILEELEVPYSVTVASAHRTPDLVEDSVKGSSAKVFIAIAGLSAALPGAAGTGLTGRITGDTVGVAARRALSSAVRAVDS